MDWETGWTQQFHYGAIRNNNTKMFKLLGPDTGFDSIGEFTTAKLWLNSWISLNTSGKLTKTILYNLNPCANEVIILCWVTSGWFYTRKDSVRFRMVVPRSERWYGKTDEPLSLLGLLSRFVGMLDRTLVHSCLIQRHEYFRRTLCNLLGNDVENGEIPACRKWNDVQQMVEDICYNNAKKFFEF